jgi:tetratricopeptide (TPR) repeat protein
MNDMGFWQDLRDSRTVERLASDSDSGALATLEEIRARQGPRPRTLETLARLRSQRGEVEAALAAAEEAAAYLGPAAGRILRAEILCDAMRKDEARALLVEARGAEPGNVAAEGFLLVLEMEDSTAAGRPPELASLPPGALWCSVVLSRLLLALEGQIEGRVAGGKATPELHRARAHLFRPRLEPDRFRRFWLEGLKGGGRRQAVRAALRAGDLPKAASILERGTEETPEQGQSPLSDEEYLLAMEIAFSGGGFGEATRLHASWMKKGGDRADPYPAALAAYALLAEGKPNRAREVLAPPLECPGRKAEIRHLAALIEVHEGALPRAAALLRLAAMDDDISMVNLAREEARYLGDSKVVS